MTSPDNTVLLKALEAIDPEYGAANDTEAEVCLRALRDSSLDVDTRAGAAILLGPGLEYCDEIFGWEDEDPDEAPFSEAKFKEVCETLRSLYRDTEVPKLLRRRAFEALLAIAEDWQPDAIREALRSDDPDWVVTGVFATGFREGFDKDLDKALADPLDDRVLFEAVRACGRAGAVRHAATLEKIAENADGTWDQDTQVAAIEALVLAGRSASLKVLENLKKSGNDEVADAAAWAYDERAMFGAFR